VDNYCLDRVLPVQKVCLKMAASDFALALHGKRVTLFTQLFAEMPGLPAELADPASTEHQIALQFAVGHAANVGRFREAEPDRVQEDAEGIAEKLEVS